MLKNPLKRSINWVGPSPCWHPCAIQARRNVCRYSHFVLWASVGTILLPLETLAEVGGANGAWRHLPYSTLSSSGKHSFRKKTCKYEIWCKNTDFRAVSGMRLETNTCWWLSLAFLIRKWMSLKKIPREFPHLLPVTSKFQIPRCFGAVN